MCHAWSVAGRSRWVVVLGAAGAVGLLVAVRLGGGDPSASSGSGGELRASATTSGPQRVFDETGEPGLSEPRSDLTRDQLDGIRFVDVTREAGLASAHSALPLIAEKAMSSGAAVADFDVDGWPDVYLTRVGRPNSLYRNLGDGTFADVTDAAGVGGSADGGSGAVAFADVDANGCPDLYVAGAGTTEAILYVSDCAGRFADETIARGVALPPTMADLGAQGHGVTFADYDHDGDLDLLVLHWDPAFLGGSAGAAAYESTVDATSTCVKATEIRRLGGDRVAVAGPNRSRLFNNDGTGHFTDVTTSVGLELDRIAAFTGDFVDMDADGWEDLLVAGDFCTSTLYRNEGGQRFVDVTDASGVGTAENAMGSVVRDVNGDGRPDWFVTSIALRTVSGTCKTRRSNTGCSGNRLYLNAGAGKFDDATDGFGVRHGGWGWGAAIEDFGNDGRLEFAQTNGYVQTGTGFEGFETDATRLWVPTGDRNHHEDGAALAGLESTGIGHALVPFDYDLDGDLDLLIANFGEPPELHRNDSPRDRHWITVQLDDPGHPGNRRGIGARIVVTPRSDVGQADSGARSRTGWISTGGSYESQRQPLFHVGLGTNDAPVRVEVWWPGSTEAQVVSDVESDRLVTISRDAAQP